MARRFLHWLYATGPHAPDCPMPVPVCRIILVFCTAWGVALVIRGGFDW